MAKLPEARFAISALVKLDCLVGPIKRADAMRQDAYTDMFEVFETLSMPEPVYLRAAQFRARFGLKTPDALHLACAQHHRCEALWTNDDRLHVASHGLARMIPQAMNAGQARCCRCSSPIVMATLWAGAASMSACAENV